MDRDATQPNPRPVDDSGNALFERAKLFSERGLEVDRQLHLGNSRHDVFPVLSEAEQKKAANVSGPKTSNQARLRLVVDNESSGGYISGRSSCLGTPEILSTNSTLLGGTPDLRHLEMACSETPHLDASFVSPPPPSMARSITSASTFMPPSLQPIVGNRQQPIRAERSDSMQLVVVKTKIEAREEFSRNLNKELDRLQAPKRGRPIWLRKQIGEIVSRETCRKWLQAKDMPDEAHMSVLIDRLGLNHQFLRTGRWESSPGAKDMRFAEIEKAWPHLDEGIREAILSVARAGKPATAENPTAHRRRQR
jgi:hypothetical protein